jgi:hypothetical protein
MRKIAMRLGVRAQIPRHARIAFKDQQYRLAAI